MQCNNENLTCAEDLLIELEFQKDRTNLVCHRNNDKQCSSPILDANYRTLRANSDFVRGITWIKSIIKDKSCIERYKLEELQSSFCRQFQKKVERPQHKIQSNIVKDALCFLTRRRNNNPSDRLKFLYDFATAKQMKSIESLSCQTNVPEEEIPLDISADLTPSRTGGNFVPNQGLIISETDDEDVSSTSLFSDKGTPEDTQFQCSLNNIVDHECQMQEIGLRLSLTPEILDLSSCENQNNENQFISSFSDTHIDVFQKEVQEKVNLEDLMEYEHNEINFEGEFTNIKSWNKKKRSLSKFGKSDLGTNDSLLNYNESVFQSFTQHSQRYSASFSSDSKRTVNDDFCNTHCVPTIKCRGDHQVEYEIEEEDKETNTSESQTTFDSLLRLDFPLESTNIVEIAFASMQTILFTLLSEETAVLYMKRKQWRNTIEEEAVNVIFTLMDVSENYTKTTIFSKEIIQALKQTLKKQLCCQNLNKTSLWLHQTLIFELCSSVNICVELIEFLISELNSLQAFVTTLTKEKSRNLRYAINQLHLILHTLNIILPKYLTLCEEDIRQKRLIPKVTDLWKKYLDLNCTSRAEMRHDKRRKIRWINELDKFATTCMTELPHFAQKSRQICRALLE